MIIGGVRMKNKTLTDNDSMIVDIKHSVNISSHAIVDAGESLNVFDFYDRFPKKTIDRVKKLSGIIQNTSRYKDNDMVDFVGNGNSEHLMNRCYPMQYHKAVVLMDKGYGVIL